MIFSESDHESRGRRTDHFSVTYECYNKLYNIYTGKIHNYVRYAVVCYREGKCTSAAYRK